MKIIVLGAGAIGSLYGAKLSKSSDVILIARKEHADSINKHGLEITGKENMVYRLKASAQIGRIEDNTLIILTTKAHDSESAIKKIRSKLKKDTAILCLQNGLYSENIVKEIVKGRCLVLRAITNFGAIFLKPGAIRYTSYSYTAIEKSPRSKEIAGLFLKAGLNGYEARDIKYEMWKKVVFNCVVNPITAILGVENRIVADEKLHPLKRLIIDECVQVAKKDGVAFNIDFLKTINKEFRHSRNLSSMQQDLLKGRKTEICYLNGAVAELGDKHGIECPVNKAITEIIKDMEPRRKERIAG